MIWKREKGHCGYAAEQSPRCSPKCRAERYSYSRSVVLRPVSSLKRQIQIKSLTIVR